MEVVWPDPAVPSVVCRKIGFMADSAPDHAEDSPPHPRVDQPQFIPRLSYGQQGLVSLLADCGARTTVAPLYFAEVNRELALVPAALELGLVLDPATHVREKLLETRSPAFRVHAWEGPRRVRSDRSQISDTELIELATGPIDLQRSRGSTLLLTSYHVAGPVGTRGRDLDLLLARAGVAHFRAERMDEPPEHAAVNITREIYVTIAARIDDLMSAPARNQLSAAYLALDCDGFWVKLVDFHEGAGAERVKAAAAFLRALADGARPGVSDGAGQLHLAVLASGSARASGSATASGSDTPPTGAPRPPIRRATDGYAARTTRSSCARSRSGRAGEEGVCRFALPVWSARADRAAYKCRSRGSCRDRAYAGRPRRARSQHG